MNSSTLPEVTFDRVSFGFEGEQILNEFSFNAPARQHTVLKGESGSGKSTILRLLLGFHQPQKGTIDFSSKGENSKTIRRKTAWLPQDLNLGSGTVNEVITKPFEFSANRSLQANSSSQKIQTLQILGLDEDILEKQFRDLSTGQRQRVGLAICHLLDKPLLLLDEPTSALDKTSKENMTDLLLNGNRTIISTSHDPFWVKKADNVIEL
ncbi:MAG: ATP-binding cassette domain-containing protein [Bacteroidota bacterium]